MRYNLEQDINEISNKLLNNLYLLEGKTILMTGANGFLGKNFFSVIKNLNKNFLKKPIKLIMLDNFICSKNDIEILDNNIEFYEHNVIDSFSIEKSVDFVVHAAGIASPHYYRANPIETLDVSVIGTKKMLEFSKKKNAKFTFFSSSEIYGDPDPSQVPIKESYRGNVSTMGPRACYDESKRLGETLCYIYDKYFDVHTNIIRPFNVYGPRMEQKDYRILPNIANKIKKNIPIDIYGKGTQTRTFSYVTDAIYGFLLVIIKGAKGEVYNIGNSKPEISINDLVYKIKDILNQNIQVNHVDYPETYPADEPMRRCPDISKAVSDLGFKPTVELEHGLERFFKWTYENYNE